MIIAGSLLGGIVSQVGIIEGNSSFMERSGLIVAKAVVDLKNGHIPIRVINLGLEPRAIFQHTVAASFECTENPIVVPINRLDTSVKAEVGIPEHLKAVFELGKDNLNPEQSSELQSFLSKHRDLFSKDEDDLGQTHLVQHTIDTGDTKPIKQYPYRVPLAKRLAAEQEIKSMTEKGIIEESNSPWCSPIVLVTKSNGSLRFCCDFRKLNDVTIKDSQPLPRIDDTLDALSGCKWFSVLDCKSGFWQVGMTEADRQKTAFSMQGSGLWQFKVMPFGLCNAPATFERLMERVLSGLTWKICLVYIDDIIVFSKTFEEHLRNLDLVFTQIHEANLKLNPEKCKLFQVEVPFLGHVISEKGIATDSKKTKAITEWPTPKTVRDIRSFLGLCSYYRRFVENFSGIAKPLHELTEKARAFRWTDKCEQAFRMLKLKLADTPILAYPLNEGLFVLDTDASGIGLGAVLSQTQDEEERVIAYYSKCLSKAERHYCVTRRELLAVVMAVKQYHHYLYGQHFVVRSDHGALKWLSNFKKPEGQMARWLEILSSYDFEIQHRAGRVHSNADALSRRPCWEDNCSYCSKTEIRYEGEGNVETGSNAASEPQNRVVVSPSDVTEVEDSVLEVVQEIVEDKDLVRTIAQDIVEGEDIEKEVVKDMLEVEDIVEEVVQDIVEVEDIEKEVVRDMLEVEDIVEEVVQDIVEVEDIEKEVAQDMLEVEDIVEEVVQDIVEVEEIEKEIVRDTLEVEDIVKVVAPEIVEVEDIVDEVVQDIVEVEDIVDEVSKDIVEVEDIVDEVAQDIVEVEDIVDEVAQDIVKVEDMVDEVAQDIVKVEDIVEVEDIEIIDKAGTLGQIVEARPGSYRHRHVEDGVEVEKVCEVRMILGENSTSLDRVEGVSVNIGAVDGGEANSGEVILSKELIVKSQEDDLILNLVRQWKVQDRKPKWAEISRHGEELKYYWVKYNSIEIKNDLVCHGWVGQDKHSVSWQIIVPKSLRKQILEELHASCTSGHMGVKKTLARVRQRFFWMKMRSDVEIFCKQCIKCASRSRRSRKMKASMKQYIVGEPLERVGMDIMGPLPCSDYGNKYVLVVADYFTKWLTAIPIANQEAATVASHFVEKFVSVFGVPKQLHTDQGTNFQSRLFRELCEVLGIDKTRTTAFRPQSDGLVERANRTLQNMLAKFVATHQRDWDKYLPLVTLAYNSAVHESTGYSPSLLMFGRQINLPIDLVLGNPNDEVPKDRTEFVIDIEEKLSVVHELARKRLQFASDTQKRRYDHKAHEHAYKEGDKVWLHNPQVKQGLSRKLTCEWNGPFLIVDKINDVVYRIQRNARSKCKVVHHDRLKLYLVG